MLWSDASRKFKCSILTFSLVILHNIPSIGQVAAPDPGYKLLHGSGFVQSKNYYLLTLFTEVKDVKALLAQDTVLQALSFAKQEALTSSLRDCDGDGSCFISRMKFSEEEISIVSSRLSQIYTPANALGKLVSEHLVPSGTYVIYHDLSARELLAKAWQQEALAVNWAVDVYGSGKAPNYPKIDSISFKTKDPKKPYAYSAGYTNLLYNTATVVAAESHSPSFYSLPLTAALRFIEMNERNQAADFEPMEKVANKAAFERIKNISWNNYRYSVILIPGAGPEDPEVALSAEGMLRCRLAAIQYKQGLAPFIMPSGGCVHPYKTKFNEAVEMRKYLVETLGVAANAIIIEPHARHTTTNMRNAARLMFRYGMPLNKPGLTTTTRLQSKWIGSTLIERCQKELNEIPYRIGNRLSETSVEFYPLMAALQLDPDEPMDP